MGTDALTALGSWTFLTLAIVGGVCVLIAAACGVVGIVREWRAGHREHERVWELEHKFNAKGGD